MLVVLWLSLGLAASSLIGCNSASAEATAETQIRTTPEGPKIASAEGHITPLQQADLAFATNGTVMKVEVEEGEAIAKGQVLARLDNQAEQANLAEAEAKLANARANLTKAYTSLDQAEANLAETKAGATAEQIAQGEADMAKAEASLAELMEQPTKEDIAQAKASVTTAQANLANIQAGSRQEDIEAAAAQVLKAESEVRLAQADYDKYVYGDPDVAEPYGVALQQATQDYQVVKADYDKLVSGSTPEEITVYQAQLGEAQTALNKTLAGATPAQIAQAQAEVERAKAALTELKAGSTIEQIVASEANVASAQAGIEIAKTDVESAQAAVTSAKVSLAKTELIAPFAGIIGSLPINEGEYVQTGAPVMTLGNASGWQIETSDLTEIDRVGIEVGSPVTFTADALPGQTFTGRVTRITPKSELKAGDQTYTVTIEITGGETSALTWGMTVYVDIEVGPEL